MKIVTTQQFDAAVDEIINDRQTQSKITHQTFNGMSKEELLNRLDKYIGDKQWAVKKSRPKFDWNDIDAVASSRYAHKIGLNILLGTIVIIMGLSVLSAYRMIPYAWFYSGSMAAGLIGVLLYGIGKRKARKEFREAFKSGSEEVE
jgi:hypothetical protein